MDLNIINIVDRGIIDKERVHIRAIADINLCNYALITSKYETETSISTGKQNFYWFDPKDVNKGDNVVLYSKSGIPSVKPNKDGTKTHFFYWDMPEAVFVRKVDCAVLLNVVDWQTSSYLR